MPALSLQPLLENAFVHAVEPRSGPTTLRISARRQDDRLLLQVADNGPGPQAAAGRPGGGVGLANLRERLQALYGPAATLQLRARPGGGSEALLQIPMHPSSAVLRPGPLPSGAAPRTHA